MANIRRERVRYGTTLPNNGIFDGELFVLTVEGSDNLLYMWNANDDAWETIAGDSADIVANSATVAGTITVTGASTFDGAVNIDAGGVVSAGLSIGSSNGPSIYRARVAVTTAEISNLAATPKELVAAVAGKVAVPLYVAISKTATTAHNDAAAAGNLIIQTSSTTQIGSSIEADGFVDDTTAETAFWVPAALVLPHADAGDALQLANDGGEFTDGGSADTAFVVEVLYLLVDPADPAA